MITANTGSLFLPKPRPNFFITEPKRKDKSFLQQLLHILTQNGKFLTNVFLQHKPKRLSFATA